MFKNKGLAFIVTPLLIMILASVWYLFYYSTAQGSTDANIIVIQEHINASGKLVDIRNEIGMNDIEDIRYYVSEDEIRIKFGRLVLTWTPEDFVSDETQEKLEDIGFSVEFKGEPIKMYLYWQNEEIERWVR